MEPRTASRHPPLPIPRKTCKGPGCIGQGPFFMRVRTIPEATEVEKLRRQLDPAWSGREITRITALWPKAGKFLCMNGKPEAPAKWFKNKTMGPVQRYAKFIWVPLTLTEEAEVADFGWAGWSLTRTGPEALKIHLSSTGWFLPDNNLALASTTTNPIVDNFIHKLAPQNKRLKLYLSDGQEWGYYDPRTWGSIDLVKGVEPHDDPQIAAMGPDWLLQTSAAKASLVSAKTNAAAKDVLTNQRIAAGVGNYLACEALYLSGVHPRRRWKTLSEAERVRVAEAIRQFLEHSITKDDHSHWQVFGQLGRQCPACQDPILYVKDGQSAKRGSYFCPTCQPENPS